MRGRFEGSAANNGDVVAARGSRARTCRAASQFLSVSWPAAKGAHFELLSPSVDVWTDAFVYACWTHGSEMDN